MCFPSTSIALEMFMLTELWRDEICCAVSVLVHLPSYDCVMLYSV